MIDSTGGLVFLGVDVGEEPAELAVVGARPLQVEQVPGLGDALQAALLAQLPENDAPLALLHRVKFAHSHSTSIFFHACMTACWVCSAAAWFLLNWNACT